MACVSMFMPRAWKAARCSFTYSRSLHAAKCYVAAQKRLTCHATAQLDGKYKQSVVRYASPGAQQPGAQQQSASTGCSHGMMNLAAAGVNEACRHKTQALKPCRCVHRAQWAQLEGRVTMRGISMLQIPPSHGQAGTASSLVRHSQVVHELHAHGLAHLVVGAVQAHRRRHQRCTNQPAATQPCCSRRLPSAAAVSCWGA
eukprot:GHRQ01017035.1.p1 GENE.GHRQ01017035.1~~GHRQ01017035.1.p1  ORF type:complete len:200 (-),score=36.40 GHRQ01017035.1:69-668(-)